MNMTVLFVKLGDSCFGALSEPVHAPSDILLVILFCSLVTYCAKCTKVQKYSFISMVDHPSMTHANLSVLSIFRFMR